MTIDKKLCVLLKGYAHNRMEVMGMVSFVFDLFGEDPVEILLEDGEVCWGFLGHDPQEYFDPDSLPTELVKAIEKFRVSE